MLRALCIRNIVLIDNLLLEFGPGFSVFTGETGAGKSILLDALSLALGSRAETHLVRQGEEKGIVVAEFDIPKNQDLLMLLKEAGVYEQGDDALYLKRTLSKEGISRAFVNDQPVTVGFLRRLSAQLVEVHGQFDKLLEPKEHRQFLDCFGGHEVALRSTLTAYENWHVLKEKYKKLLNDSGRERKILLEHYLEELGGLDLQPGGYQHLLKQRDRLAHGEKIREALQLALGNLSYNPTNAETNLSEALKACENVASYDDRLRDTLESLQSALIHVQETCHGLGRLLESIEVDPKSLDSIESQLSLFKNTARKHHCGVEDLTQIYEKLCQEFQDLDNRQENLIKLEKECCEAKECYEIQASRLTKARHETAQKLEIAVKKELGPLKMDRATFKVEFRENDEAGWSAQGKESVSFVVAPNGSVFGPLRQIASGGERSRFMLALKVALAGQNDRTALIFDEIDSGVGGAVATAIGGRLHVLSQNTQVLCVTHSPQVASWGHRHFKVVKSSNNNDVTTCVTSLDTNNSEEEIARMLSGENVTDQARAAAKTLKQDAASF